MALRAQNNHNNRERKDYLPPRPHSAFSCRMLPSFWSSVSPVTIPMAL